jgi:hypothetical protein
MKLAPKGVNTGNKILLVQLYAVFKYVERKIGA